jgi:hypothetical protein
MAWISLRLSLPLPSTCGVGAVAADLLMHLLHRRGPEFPKRLQDLELALRWDRGFLGHRENIYYVASTFKLPTL